MSRPHCLHAASSAALLGAAVILVGCDENDEDMSQIDGQVQMQETDLDEMDPNELPADMQGEDETLGDSRLNDSTPEEPGVTEYDRTPLVSGESED